MLTGLMAIAMPSNYFSIDHIIVYAFLAITLLVGFWYGRGIKTIREYAIGDRKFGTGLLLLTFLATRIGGRTIVGESMKVYSIGIIRD